MTELPPGSPSRSPWGRLSLRSLPAVWPPRAACCGMKPHCASPRVWAPPCERTPSTPGVSVYSSGASGLSRDSPCCTPRVLRPACSAGASGARELPTAAARRYHVPSGLQRRLSVFPLSEVGSGEAGLCVPSRGSRGACFLACSSGDLESGPPSPRCSLPFRTLVLTQTHPGNGR